MKLLKFNKLRSLLIYGSIVCYSFVLFSCTQNKSQTTEVPEQEAIEEPEESPVEEAKPENYLSQIFGDLGPILSNHDGVYNKLLLPRTEWGVLPAKVTDSIPEDGRVFLMAKGESLASDRVVLVEIEQMGVHPQYLVRLDENFEPVSTHKLFTNILGEYSSTLRVIWKYGYGDILAIGIENGPWGYNHVEWQLLRLSSNGIEIVEEKQQRFETYEASEKYFQLIRDSRVDRENEPPVVLSELSVENGVTSSEDDDKESDPLAKYTSVMPSSRTVDLVTTLGFEIMQHPEQGYYDSNETKMLIPLLSETGTYTPHPNEMYCIGDNTYYFIHLKDAESNLQLAREYGSGEIHIWEITDEGVKQDDGELFFTLKPSGAYGDVGNKEQIPELRAQIYKEAASGGWILKVDDQYFATRQTLLDKFGYNEEDMACG